MQSPDLGARPGWTALPGYQSLGGIRSFVSGEPDGDRLRVAYFQRDADRSLVARAWFGPGAEGPPGHGHGGAMAALLDEALGGACWLAGHPVVAAEIRTRFLRMLPLGQTVTVETSIDGVAGREVRARGRLIGDAGTEHASAEGLYIVLDPERFGRRIVEAHAALHASKK